MHADHESERNAPAMRPPIDARLSRWSSEFVDPEVEAAFREWHHPAALGLARTVGLVVAAAALPYIYVTFLRFGDAPAFHILLAVRLAVLTLAVLLLLLVRRRIGARRLDLAIVVVIVAVEAQTLLLAAMSVPAINLLDVQVILILLCIYAFMPNSLSSSAVGTCSSPAIVMLWTLRS